MNIHVTGRQVEITPALRDYVVSKLNRITQRFDQIVDITVTLSVRAIKLLCAAGFQLNSEAVTL